MAVPSNLIPTRITQLPSAPSADPNGLLIYVLNGVTYKISAGDLLQVSGVPLTRNVLAGTGLTGGGPLSSDVTLGISPGGIGTSQLATSGVTPGSYGSSVSVPVFTVDATGRIMAVSESSISLTGFVPTTRQVVAGNGLSGGGQLTANVTLDVNLSNVLPAAGSNTGVAGISDGLSRSDHQHPAIDLADDTQVNGLLGLGSGGTARSLVPAAGAPVWSGADGLYIGTQGQAGQIYVSGGPNAPVWGTLPLITEQPANVVYAGPVSGAPADVSFRLLVSGDIPTLNQSTTGTSSNVTGLVAVANGGTGLSTLPALSLPVINVLDTVTTVVAGTLQSVRVNGGGTAWEAYTPSASTGTVSGVSVATANGFAGTVTNPSTTPEITLTTDLTGLLKGNGTAMSVATAGTDYLAPPTGTSLLKANSGGALADAIANVDYVPAVMTSAGDLMYGGVVGAATRLGVGSANTLLHGGATGPVYSAVVEADISLSANSTNDVSITRHGFAPVLPNNAALFLNGQGNYTLPSGLTISASYSATAFSGQTLVNVVHNFGTYPLVQVVDNTGAQLIPLSIVNNTLNDFTVTFASSTTGTVLASVGSPQPQALTVTASNYTVAVADRIIKGTAAGKVITLYTSVGNTGRELIINNASSGYLTVNTTSSQVISGQLTQTLPSFSSMTIYSDGANWWII